MIKMSSNIHESLLLFLTGGYPYSNFSNDEIAQLLRQGYRMRKPENCSTDMYVCSRAGYLEV